MPHRYHRSPAVVAALVPAFFAGSAMAAVQTYDDRAAFTAALVSSTTIDFEGLADPTDGYTFYGETLVVGDAAFTESSPLYPGGPNGNLLVMEAGYSAGFYETGGISSTYLNQNTGNGAPVEISFADPIYALGFDFGTLWDAGAGSQAVELMLSDGTVLSLTAPYLAFSSTPMSFFGFATDAGISSITLYDANQNLALDDLVYSTEPVAPAADVPLPGAAPLLLAGLGAVGLLRRRRG